MIRNVMIVYLIVYGSKMFLFQMHEQQFLRKVKYRHLCNIACNLAALVSKVIYYLQYIVSLCQLAELRQKLLNMRMENSQLVVQNHRLLSELEDSSHQLLMANSKVIIITSFVHCYICFWF